MIYSVLVREIKYQKVQIDAKNEAEAMQKAQNVYDSAKADSDDIRAIKTWAMNRRNYEEDQSKKRSRGWNKK